MTPPASIDSRYPETLQTLKSEQQAKITCLAILRRRWYGALSAGPDIAYPVGE